MPHKNISYSDFLNALDIVSHYKKQNSDDFIFKNSFLPKGRTVNLNGKLTNSMFKVLVRYYNFKYKILITGEDLKYMHANLLASIDYRVMLNYRGIGNFGISKMQKIIEYSLEQ